LSQIYCPGTVWSFLAFPLSVEFSFQERNTCFTRQASCTYFNYRMCLQATLSHVVSWSRVYSCGAGNQRGKIIVLGRCHLVTPLTRREWILSVQAAAWEHNRGSRFGALSLKSTILYPHFKRN